VWVLDPSGKGPGAWHVDRDGVIDAVDPTGFGPKVDGNASAFDPGSDAVWVVHYDGTVTRVAWGADRRHRAANSHIRAATYMSAACNELTR
jgi:hypothetical protein